MKSAKSPYDTLKNYILADGYKVVFDHQKSHGSYIVDQVSGRDYLDLFSFFATQPIRFNHPKMLEPAFIQHMGERALYRPTLSDVYTEDYAKAVETFATIAGRDFFKYYFFVEGGTLGVENALKVAFDWKVRKNLKKGLGEKGSQIIHFKDAFHGRSGYAMSMTNTNDPNKHKYFPKFPWPRVLNPYLSFPLTDEIVANTIKKEQESLSQIKQALKDHPGDIAGLIIEPIQAEGGDHHFRREFLQSLRELSLQEDFLLILDEVQTGIGITGKMWAFEHLGFTPDVISFGKKVQVGGCAVTDRIDDIEDHVFKVGSRINSTWGGNLIDMIRMTRFMEIIQAENLIDHTEKMGAYFMGKLQELSKNNPHISNVRGQGLMMAFDLPTPEHRNKLKDEMYHEGAIILACGAKSLRLRPHLDITKAEIDHAIDLIQKADQTIKN